MRIGRRRCKIASRLESRFLKQVLDAGLPAPVEQHRFAKAYGRQWTADFCWPAFGVIAECEGSIYAQVRGRHIRGPAFEEDSIKYFAADMLGFTVVRMGDHLIRSGVGVLLVRLALIKKGWKDDSYSGDWDAEFRRILSVGPKLQSTRARRLSGGVDGSTERGG